MAGCVPRDMNCVRGQSIYFDGVAVRQTLLWFERPIDEVSARGAVSKVAA